MAKWRPDPEKVLESRTPFRIYFLRLLILCQAVALAATVILHVYAKIDPFRLVLVYSFIFSNCIWFPVGLTMYALYGNWTSRDTGITALFRNFLAAFLATQAGFELALLLIWVLFHHQIIPFWSRRHLWFLLANIFFVFITEAVKILFSRLRNSLKRTRLDFEKMSRLQLQTRLAALQARTNPHFLFNALNALAGLVHENPDRAERALIDLAGLYRHILENTDREEISVGDELEIARKYLEVEKIRLHDRLEYRIECGSGLEKVKIPPLLIQPLVENAVIHGVSRTIEGGSVFVTVSGKAGSIQIVIEDNGPGWSGDVRTGKKSGFGLDGVRERLRLAYGNQGRIVLSAPSGGGVRVMLEMPDGAADDSL